MAGECIPVCLNCDPKLLYNYFQLIAITIVRKKIEKIIFLSNAGVNELSRELPKELGNLTNLTL